MIAAVDGLLAQVKDGYPSVDYLRGHRESPDASTSCPGDQIMQLITDGAFTFDGNVPVTAAPAPIPPAVAAGLPHGKALLMALIDAPDFPLLRTSKGHLCYYGPSSGPVESVSGHNDNSLNPGDIIGGHSVGLRIWQKRMKARGYSITIDGLYGPESENACKNLQKLADITADGKVGPDAWYAAFLLPIQK